MANSAFTQSTILTPVTVANGGTAITSYTLGDILYSSSTNTLSKLAGNTTSTKKFLRQTGTGSISAAPLWEQLNFADLSYTGTDISAYLGTNQALTISTYNVINIDTEITDSLNEFNTTTHAFTPSVTGTYIMTFDATLAGATIRMIAALITSGVAVTFFADGVLSQTIGTIIVDLTAGVAYNFAVYPLQAGVTALLGAGITYIRIRRVY